MRIDLVGTTADFGRFGHPQPLPINYLLRENRRLQGRIGEVGLAERMKLMPIKYWAELAIRIIELMQMVFSLF